MRTGVWPRWILWSGSVADTALQIGIEQEGIDMKYYAVADVHGHYTILHDTLERAGFFADPEPHKLIICGDLLDRGAETLEMQALDVGNM